LYTLLLFAGGLAAGFTNTIAGGGSLITLPVLVLTGLPADIANGTNRVAVFCQNAVAVSVFGRKRVRILPPLDIAVWSVLGALIGAQIAVQVPRHVLERIFGGALAALTLLMLVRSARPAASSSPRRWGRAWVRALVFFVVGLWGGFAQVGVGFFLLYALAMLTPLRLLEANAIKNFMVLLHTVPSLVVFAWHGQVALVPGLTVGLGSAIGAYLAAHFAVRKGEHVLRALVALFAIAAAVWLLFF
jgi:uncharacterized membrane protein YfcA